MEESPPKKTAASMIRLAPNLSRSRPRNGENTPPTAAHNAMPIPNCNVVQPNSSCKGFTNTGNVNQAIPAEIIMQKKHAATTYHPRKMRLLKIFPPFHLGVGLLARQGREAS